MIASRLALIVPALGIALISATFFAYAETKPDPRKLELAAVEIEAQPVTSFYRLNSSVTDFGKLTFRGGLILTAPNAKSFGGWSGLIVDDQARKFFAISDSGVWMRGELTYAAGKLTGVVKATLGPVLATDGGALKRKRDRDAEAVALESGTLDEGSLLVAFELKHRIARYALSREGFSPAQGMLELPDAVRRMRRNNGFEAMTVIKGGLYNNAVIAVSERLYDAARNHTGWIWTSEQPQTFHITNIRDFDVTDMASDGDGTLYVLERRFRWFEGVKMRVRRFAPGEIAPDKTADGEVLFEANLEYEIDNMEGLAVSHGPQGETVLTMISDDNFNHYVQKTIVLQFAVNNGQTAKTQP